MDSGLEAGLGSCLKAIQDTDMTRPLAERPLTTHLLTKRPLTKRPYRHAYTYDTPLVYHHALYCHWPYRHSPYHHTPLIAYRLLRKQTQNYLENRNAPSILKRTNLEVSHPGKRAILLKRKNLDANHPGKADPSTTRAILLR